MFIENKKIYIQSSTVIARVNLIFVAYGGFLFNGNPKSFNLLFQTFVMWNKQVTASIPKISIAPNMFATSVC